jgi:hypothetical protein
MALDIEAGPSLDGPADSPAESLGDDDTVMGSDAADLIMGGRAATASTAGEATTR